MDDPQALAKSILTMYGNGAEKIAAGYAEKHRCAGDAENRAVWLAVLDIIRGQQAAKIGIASGY